MTTKPFWRSKTVWFNVLTVILVIASFFGFSPDPDTEKQTREFLLITIPLVNLLLRFITEKKISFR